MLLSFDINIMMIKEFSPSVMNSVCERERDESSSVIRVSRLYVQACVHLINAVCVCVCVGAVF